MRLTLKNDGYAWRTIYQGRNKVGRVWQHAETKKFHGMIGRDEATGTSFEDAFRNVAAKKLGFLSVQSLHSHNAAVKQRNAQVRAAGRHAVQELLNGNFRPLDALFTKATERTLGEDQ